MTGRFPAMFRNKACLPLQPPSRPMLQELPPELLHSIVAHLESILSLRSTCAVLAAVGADYILNDVGLVYERESFEHLKAIAEHPRFSARVRSLFYHGDRFEQKTSYNDWDDRRRDESVTSPLMDIEPELMHTERHQRFMRRGLQKWQTEKKGKHTKAELTRAYDAYLQLLSDQTAIAEEGYDLKCLADFFTACTGLRDVILTFGQSELDSDGPYPTRKAAHAAMMGCPAEDEDWRMQGVRQINTIAAALSGSGRQLHSLTLDQVSPRLFDEPQHDLEQFAAIIRPLHRFRMSLQTWPATDERDEEEELMEEEMIEAIETFAESRPVDYLREAKDLRVLKLIFPMEASNEELASMAPLELFTGDFTWTRLLDLALKNCVTSEEHFVAFILRHKDTLKRLALANIELDTGTWVSAFQQLGGRLPKLRRISLDSAFSSWEAGQSEFDFPDSRRISPYRDAMENFMLKGGQWPDFESLEWKTCYPEDAVEYEPPSLHDNEPDPEDPGQVYEWDGFDAWI